MMYNVETRRKRMKMLIKGFRFEKLHASYEHVEMSQVTWTFYYNYYRHHPRLFITTWDFSFWFFTNDEWLWCVVTLYGLLDGCTVAKKKVEELLKTLARREWNTRGNSPHTLNCWERLQRLCWKINYVRFNEVILFPLRHSTSQLESTENSKTSTEQQQQHQKKLQFEEVHC